MKVSLLALDVAILPPPDVAQRAIESSASLPTRQFQGLRLGPDRLPHITLTQQFVRASDLDAVSQTIDAVLRDQGPLTLRVIGGGKGSSSVWMTIDRTGALATLHRNLMVALQRFEQPKGAVDAFVDGDARIGDVRWVATYRRQASFDAFRPHITLGHADAPPAIESLTFEATSVAACHLGRFCTCQRILRTWELR